MAEKTTDEILLEIKVSYEEAFKNIGRFKVATEVIRLKRNFSSDEMIH